MVHLNIDTPAGVAFTVNKTVQVDTTGRIMLKLDVERPAISVEEGKVVLRYLDSKREVVASFDFVQAEAVAYDLLGRIAALRAWR